MQSCFCNILVAEVYIRVFACVFVLDKHIVHVFVCIYIF